MANWKATAEKKDEQIASLRSEKPAIPEGWKLVCEKCGADTSGPCGWPNNCLAGLVVPPSPDGNEESK
jgi:hypothetical protein